MWEYCFGNFYVKNKNLCFSDRTNQKGSTASISSVSVFFSHSVFKAALKEAEFQRKEHIRKQGMNIFDDLKKHFGTSSKQV